MSLSITRKTTRRIMVGDVAVGGGAPISVQSMTNTKTDDVDATVGQIQRLTQAGCEIARVAVPDESAAQAISRIKPAIDVPLVADIHFDYRLAIASARNGADGLRFNPGNIGSRKNIRALVDCAKDCRIPIRIGVNAGSLEKDILEKHRGVTAKGMVESALRHAALLQDLDFHDIKISIKASDVPRTLEAYRMLSQRTDLPLHVGVTEAGALYSGIVKSALGIGTLLAEGIGDTLRVSLTRDPVEEVRVGFEILRALDIRHRGPEIVSCPTCGRCDIPLFEIVDAVEKALMTRTTPVKLAIMGCVVNGPGEAREADIGVAGGNGVGILFKKGKVVKKFPQDRLVDVVLDAVDEFERQNKSR
ncbi:flavodoxin-dependent (E)-4-hydroxy-3-methylbut-2-enyl-diphosphate synthase [uncultured Desulfosarcina sp.]|uniref:flavodoxin-dependent (E)-4-hydroxy-3-methylbut-2-enyl-diphosphate synthase n=1 Tax=uncultured Desulfosarcina sp. TaxID=218289 RepID=UPI0029C8DF30|nr:flavodoxin-dependent (E)-4-hydroxy-3-methylbut-2-enyl-diphosphate synthase [uncultured Desulfosarcina sp.]